MKLPRLLLILFLLLINIACTNIQTVLEPTSASSAPVVTPETAAPTAAPTTTAAPTETASPTSEPDIPLPATVAEVNTAGVSFFYDADLFPSFTVEKVTAAAGTYGFGVDGPPFLYYDVPDFIHFKLATTAPATRPTLLVIQPIRNTAGEIYASYQGQFDFDYQRFVALEEVLNTQPETPDTLTLRHDLPHLKYVDFSNGRGVRYIGLIPPGPGLLTVTNEELYYIYEGLSDDGRYYIWLQYPISTNTLPNQDELDITEVEAINNGDVQAWLNEQMAALNALPVSHFEPDLRRLDLMMETLFVAPEASTVTSIPSNDPACVNEAQFVADVTIPDGTPIQPRTEFTKTWRLRNTGTCTWSAAFFLASPPPYPAITPVRTDHNKIPVVPPGEETELSITLLAPPVPGYYRSEWQLQPPFDLTGGPIPAGFGPVVYTEITVNSAAAVAIPAGTWEIQWITGNNVPDTLYEEAIGRTIVFGPDFITFDDETCTGISYNGRFVYGNELPDYDTLVPEDLTTNTAGYLELIQTTCHLPNFDQFIWHNVPFGSEILIRYGDEYYAYLIPQK